MSEDQTFRIVLAVCALAVLPIGLTYRLKSRTPERLDRRQEGTFILATLRPAALAFWFALVAYLIDPRWMAWSSAPFPARVRWTGVGVWFLTGALLFWTLHHLGANLTDTVVTRRNHTLVTDGPYRWVRNPFYDCAALLVLAASLVAANWFLLVTGAVVFGLLVLRTRREEERLLARFGEEYRQYMTHTGQFLPRLRSTRVRTPRGSGADV